MVALWGTGLGQTSPGSVDGLDASNITLQYLSPVQVTIGGVNAFVAYAGVAYLQRNPVQLRTDDLAASLRGLAASARARLELHDRVPATPARRRPAPAESELEPVSSPNGYGW